LQFTASPSQQRAANDRDISNFRSIRR